MTPTKPARRLSRPDQGRAAGLEDLRQDPARGPSTRSVTAAHELLEMVIDPVANLWAEATDGTEYAYEMCDPVKEDTFLVDGIRDVEFPASVMVRAVQASA